MAGSGEGRCDDGVGRVVVGGIEDVRRQQVREPGLRMQREMKTA